ncbi:baseplate protein [Roseovarius spongiae]|uniref:Baseplate protein n=1 Tax=Roseovarius spongiae TaxID=2320272 RepID=A0A3A8AUY7_9RHOB|nr:GPW/gp25 family protein [Roseovarius spongiae]RKF14888.1 baseplate protein [Roseovarius spongiae]
MSAPRKFLGTGFAFPLRVTPNGGIALVSEERLVQQSIWLILATGKGELKRNPTFGCGIHDFVFTDNTPASQAQIAHQAREALLHWERRIDVIDIHVGDGEAPNHLLISIEYRLRATHAFGNLVFPFYLLDEGGSGRAA